MVLLNELVLSFNWPSKTFICLVHSNFLYKSGVMKKKNYSLILEFKKKIIFLVNFIIFYFCFPVLALLDFSKFSIRRVF